MKYLLTSLIIGLCCPTVLRSQDTNLSAYDLARGLGISTWVSNLKLSGKDVLIEILKVRDGNIQNVVAALPVYSTDREFTHVVITAREDGRKMYLSATAEASVLARTTTDKISFGCTMVLPPIVGFGDYVLGGSLKESAGYQAFDDLSTADLSEGLVLRVSQAAEQGAAANP